MTDVIWNDFERCAEIFIDEISITLVGVQDVLVDANVKFWGTNEDHIQVELGEQRVLLKKQISFQAEMRHLIIDEILRRPRYTALIEEVAAMLYEHEQNQYPRDVGYGHMMHELI